MNNIINPEFENLFIKEEHNPYRECIQGLANEPICVHRLLLNSQRFLKDNDWGDISLDEIVKRLVQNRPRVAIIGGSMDHPAHLLDEEYAYRAAKRIWYNGGIPFYFQIPVICDGTAQNNIGQSYSLASRNQTAAMVNTTFEGHSYHAAWVISGCDKSPSGILSGLAAADYARGQPTRGQAPVWANFIPAHVLKGGNIPPKTLQKILDIEKKAIENGHKALAADFAENRRYILQCSSDEAFFGLVKRAEDINLISKDELRDIMNSLAVATCNKAGGVCAFNGTGNSSRTLLCALGFVPKDLELLCSPPTQEQADKAMDQFFRLFNKKEYSVCNILEANFSNAVKIHSTTGSSTNLLLHLPAIMRYAGYDIRIWDYANIHNSIKIPEIFDHSLTEGRDSWVLAQQFLNKQNHGMESIYKILDTLKIPLNLDAPTMGGATWGQRIAKLDNPIDESLGEKSVIKTTPIRNESGVDILSGNLCSSAVVKISGMTTQQYQFFDQRLFLVKYYENEHLCNADLMAKDFIERLTANIQLKPELIAAFAKYNGFEYNGQSTYELLEQQCLSFCLIIAGQGPKAYGMPEMFSPSENLRHHKLFEASSILLTDGRYSGVTKGACIGHATPEAHEGGAIGTLQDGDILWLRLQEQKIDIIDTEALLKGDISLKQELFTAERKALLEQRKIKADKRLLEVAASNVMYDVTNAENGVVPFIVDQRATKKIGY
ncbi:MAG: dihydroxy-acid dehydratase [Alphaproteobacteria bacterium]